MPWMAYHMVDGLPHLTPSSVQALLDHADRHLAFPGSADAEGIQQCQKLVEGRVFNGGSGS